MRVFVILSTVVALTFLSCRSMLHGFNSLCTNKTHTLFAPQLQGCRTECYNKFGWQLLSDLVQVLTKDSVTVTVDAVIYYRVQEPLNAVVKVNNYSHSTRLLAATTLRNVLGTRNLSEILSDREAIAHMMQTALDDATDPWGVKVERVEM